MACSYEQYEKLIAPNQFYAAGVPRVRAYVGLAATVPLVAMAWSHSTRWMAAGYLGALLIAGLLALNLRRVSLRHWSRESQRALRDLKERDAFIVERLIDALLAMCHHDLHIAQRELSVELPHAVEELRERRSRVPGSPRWFGILLSGCLTTALALVARAPTLPAIGLLAVGVAGATLFLFATALVDAVLPSTVFGMAGYVRILRLAKRRVDLELVRAQPPEV